mmetsp:Transcript_19981/g.65074  ORF Transcript_19981/g.65074 Transcript_19981/m.65074 type:complete len:662 (-) Transcript_19981:944-2929(-)
MLRRLCVCCGTGENETPLATWDEQRVKQWLLQDPAFEGFELKGLTGFQLTTATDASLIEAGIDSAKLRAQLLSKVRDRVEYEQAEDVQASLGGGDEEKSEAAVTTVASIATRAQAWFEERKALREEAAAAGEAAPPVLEFEGDKVELPPGLAFAQDAADFGLEFVKGILEVGDKLPVVGSIFGVALLVCATAEQTFAARRSCQQLSGLCGRVARALLHADPAVLERVGPSTARLRDLLTEALALVAGYSDKGWLQRFASMKKDTALFASLHESIQEEMQFLQFDIQITTPAYKDESKAMQARVLELTGRSVEDGGLEILLERTDGREELRQMLGLEAKVLASEIDLLAGHIGDMKKDTTLVLDVAQDSELLTAVELQVQIFNLGKGCGPSALAARLMEVEADGGFKVGYRVMRGLPIFMRLKLVSNDKLHSARVDDSLIGISSVTAHLTYKPVLPRRLCNWCCGMGVDPKLLHALTIPVTASVTSRSDLAIDEDDPLAADVELHLPDDSGYYGNPCSLEVAIKVGVQRPGSSAQTTEFRQTICLAVFKKFATRARFMDASDAAADVAENLPSQIRVLALLPPPLWAVAVASEKRARARKRLKQNMAGGSMMDNLEEGVLRQAAEDLQKRIERRQTDAERRAKQTKTQDSRAEAASPAKTQL